MMKIENGFITDDGQMVWAGPGSKMTISRAVDLACPTMEGAPVAYLDHLEDLTRTLLRTLPPEMSLQLRWSQFSDYQSHLLDYHDATENLSPSRWGRRNRNERFVRYSQDEERGEMRGDRVRLFLKRDFSAGRGTGNFRKRCSDLLRDSAAGFDIPLNEIMRMMGQVGGRGIVLNELDLFEEVYRSFHPGSGRLTTKFLSEQYHPEHSILRSCLGGDFVPVPAPEASFYHAGRYHGSLALSGLPSSTFSGIIEKLTSLRIRGFSMTVNLETLDLAREIEKAENIKAKLEKARANSPRVRMDYAIQSAETRIQRYMSGEVVPMRYQLILHASDESKEGLRAKLVALSSAVTSMQSAKSWENALPTTARNFFFAGLPGSSYREDSHWHLVDDNNVANLLPIAGDAHDSLHRAEALYQGKKGNLFGVNVFRGPKGKKTPSHSLITGRTGSGKSVFGIELMTQLDPYADFLAIVDNGYSYATFTNVLSNGACRPLALDVNGEDTLNYMDTGDLPLSPRHFQEVGKVMHLMAGKKTDEDADHLRSAVIERCLRLFYEEWSGKWMNDDSARRGKIVRELAAVLCFSRAKKMKKDLVENVTSYREYRDQEDRIEAVYSESELEEMVHRIAQGEEAENLMRFSYSLMNRQEAPTHSDFHGWLLAYEKVNDRDKKEVRLLGSLLEVWRADRGTKGCLFDGVNTVDLSARVVHIELSLIQDGDETLKSLASYIVSNKIMGAIIRRPRAQRKHVILEELGGFINMQGGKQIVKDFYERSRKYHCAVTSVIQQVSTLPEDLARSILGNSGQAFFFAQKEPRDTQVLQEVFELSDATIAIVKNFPEPNSRDGAPFVCWENLGRRTRATPCFNLVSPEMLYVADSNGAVYEERAQALAQYDDVLEGVIAEAAKQEQSTVQAREEDERDHLN